MLAVLLLAAIAWLRTGWKPAAYEVRYEVTSAGHLAVVGYNGTGEMNVNTDFDPPSPWSATVRINGQGIVPTVEANTTSKDAEPITCRILIDSKVVDQHTAANTVHCESPKIAARPHNHRH